mmetsp:Transcript_111039/g.319097  ORF Transcript_111039/g.319097 Transcript_111039/m.319097 type:complete len:525 (+) Transcript_111039:487-2061(+)
MVEHPLFQGHDDELRVREVRPDHVPDILRVTQVQCGVDLVQDVHGRRLEQQQGQHERKCEQRALAAAQFHEGLLPHAMEADLDFEALGGVHALRRLQLPVRMRQQSGENRVEVLVHLDPSPPESVELRLVQVPDDRFNLLLVVQDDVALLQQVLVLLLGLLEHDHGLLVDILAERLLLRIELVQPAFVVLVAVRLKVEVRALLAEKRLLLLDPWVRLLQTRHDGSGLLVVLLELLDLVAELFLLDLLVLALLLVCLELCVEIRKRLVEGQELRPQCFKPPAHFRMRFSFGLQGVLELLHLRRKTIAALARRLVLPLLRLDLVADHLELHIGLLRLLALLLQLLLVLLGLALQLLDLPLEELDPLVAARFQALDVLLELLGQLFQSLLLLRHGLDLGLGLLHPGAHLLQRLLRGVVLAPADALLDERELVLLALELPVEVHVLRVGGVHLLNLRGHVVVLLALLVHALFHVRELLQPHQQVPSLGHRAAGNRPHRIVHVAVFGHRPHADIRVKGHLLGRLGRVTD